MLDHNLACLVKENEKLDNKAKLNNFLQLWSNLNKFGDKVFIYI